jgi:hypothetical protein
MEPAIDIYARLDLVLNNIKNGFCKNEHEFQIDLFKAFRAAHDGHFWFAPDLINRALQFRRPIQIVSVNRDGVEVPKAYTRCGQLHLSE